MAKITKPRRPRSVTILGVKVKIKYTSKLMFSGNTELHGSFCGETMTIHISNHSDVSATLYHEYMHAVLFLSGVSNLISGKVEEQIVSALESALKDYFHME